VTWYPPRNPVATSCSTNCHGADCPRPVAAAINATAAIAVPHALT
jgi:hypothetical protein